MKTTIYTILFVIALIISSCAEVDIDRENQKNSNERILMIYATMPSRNASTRVSVNEIAGSLNLNPRWDASDKINLFFMQGELKVKGEVSTVSNISNNGKQAAFTIVVPNEIDLDKSFDVLGFCGITGTGVNIKDGKILVDLEPDRSQELENLSVPVWFKTEIEKIKSNNSVDFDYLGTTEITHLQNNTTNEITIDALVLQPKDGVDDSGSWAYMPYISNENGAKLIQPFFNPLTGEVEEIAIRDIDNPGTWYQFEPRNIKIPAGTTKAIASWYYPKKVNLPEMELMALSSDFEDDSIVSTNSKPAKDFPMRVGRAYHLYAVWNGNNLTMTDDDFVVEGLPKMTMTTALQPGERLLFSGIGIAQEDIENLWIDMNNNGRRDAHEDGFELRSNGQVYPISSFIVDSPTFSIYGKVHSLQLPHHLQLTQLDVSGNPELLSLFCYGNLLTVLDLTKNVELTTLACAGNQLTDLDLTGNINLTGVDCSGNQIRRLDVTKNTKLRYITCMYNQLAQLNITNNSELKSLQCGDNQLAQLDVSKNTELNTLWCQDNQLKQLDVTKNAKLSDLECYNNQLTQLDVTNNINLDYLKCENNQLTELNVKNNIHLTFLECENNQLTGLDLSKNTSLEIIRCDSNLLTQLDVNKDGALVSLSCTGNNMETEALDRLYEQLPDIKDLPVGENEKGWKKHLKVDGNPGAETSNTQIATEKGWIVDVQGSGGNTNLPRITMTTALQPGERLEFPSIGIAQEDIENLWIDMNNNGRRDAHEDGFELRYNGQFYPINSFIVDSPTFSVYGKVRYLQFWAHPQLTQLDVSGNPELTYLFCIYNQLTKLDLTKNVGLTDLTCIGNPLTELDLTGNINLTGVNCSDSPIRRLDVTKNTKLLHLVCIENQLDQLNITNNGELINLKCGGNQLAQLDVTKNTKLLDFECYNNQLAQLDVTNNIKLRNIYCENNQLAELDLSKNTSLEIIRCDSNLLTQLDVSHNRALVSLSCVGNNMETEALDRLYEQLPDIKDVTVWESEKEWKKHLKVSGNPGAETSNTQIAVDKGWIVDVEGSGFGTRPDLPGEKW